MLETGFGVTSLAGASVGEGQNFLTPLNRTDGLLLLAGVTIS